MNDNYILCRPIYFLEATLSYKGVKPFCLYPFRVQKALEFTISSRLPLVYP